MSRSSSSKSSNASQVFVIDDDELFASCITSAIQKADSSLNVKTFKNAIDAINALDSPLPVLIFLDILLPGPDGFTFLNELVSYPDTSRIPIVIVSSIDLPEFDLQTYGVVGILKKEKMLPKEVEAYVKRYSHPSHSSSSN